jgi:hypothetical protein
MIEFDFPLKLFLICLIPWAILGYALGFYAHYSSSWEWKSEDNIFWTFFRVFICFFGFCYPFGLTLIFVFWRSK